VRARHPREDAELDDDGADRERGDAEPSATRERLASHGRVVGRHLKPLATLARQASMDAQVTPTERAS